MSDAKLQVDLVYMWVDGDDLAWKKKKELATGKFIDNSETNNAGRYISNDELKYSLRAAELNAPWIRKIHIVTDNQCPDWLDRTHPKIQIVDHKDIMPAEILPCFNSSVIEYFLYKIPDLAEHFIFSNDDMFIHRKVSPNMFFNEEGYPIIRLKRKVLGKWRPVVKRMIGKKLGQYQSMIADSARMVEEKFGSYYSGVPHHNVDAYKKAEYQKAIEEIFADRAKASMHNKTRSFGDLHRSAITFYSLAIGHGDLKYVGRKTSSRILVHRHDFANYIRKYNPYFFCLNDSQRVNDDHRLLIKPFLETLYPEPSSFEK